MAIEIRTVAQSDLPAIGAFGWEVWGRRATPTFLEWRHLGPGLTTFAAFDGAVCLGLITAARRTYLVRGAPMTCLETFDWQARPNTRAPAVGLRLMRRVLAEGHPVVGMGGTDQAVMLKPRMGFLNCGLARSFILPLRARFAFHHWSGARGTISAAGLGLLCPTWFRRHPTAAVTERTFGSLGPVVEGLAKASSGSRSMVPLVDPSRIAWLAAAPSSLGKFHSLALAEGHACAQVHIWRAGGLNRAAVMDIQVAKPKFYFEAIAGVLTFLNGRDVDCVTAVTTVPEFATALKGRRFLERMGLQLQIHPNGADLSGLDFRINLDRGDDGLLPLPTEEDVP